MVIIFKHGWFHSLWLLSGFIILLVVVGGCDREVDIPAGALEEQTVDIQGEWTVLRAWQNGNDITDRLNFEDIVLTLEMDDGPTSYALQTGGAPFPLHGSGSWKYDDLAFPTKLSLNDGKGEYDLSFSVPPISGDQRFLLAFSLGCSDNKYVYEFGK